MGEVSLMRVLISLFLFMSAVFAYDPQPVIDHVNIQNIGSNSHAAIDTHIAAYLDWSIDQSPSEIHANNVTGALMPLENDAVTPTLAYGDGDSGFYELSDDVITVASGGVAHWSFRGPSGPSARFESVNTTGGRILQSNFGPTTPTYSWGFDTNTGIGASAVGDHLSLIVGGIEGITVKTSSGITNVGITASTPDAKLEVDGGTSVQDILHFGNATSTVALVMDMDGGITLASPTGGSKGSGTLNAVGLYDDNVLLTDYVFEKEYLGQPIDIDKQDYVMKNIDEEIEFTKKNLHLSTIIGRQEWEQNGKPSTGQLINQLWETSEIQFLYIKEIHEKIYKLEQEIKYLKKMEASK